MSDPAGELIKRLIADEAVQFIHAVVLDSLGQAEEFVAGIRRLVRQAKFFT